ncbi:MAG: phage portal protein, partial [Clostridia bacterium]|nr:phage portal protein [Clostridia bacterium]
RLDGIEQSVQQLCVAYNCQFEEGTTANSIREAGMLVLRSVGDNQADFKILEAELDQTATQTTVDDLYAQMLEKCGVPFVPRDGGSTADNVGAVYLRSGWASADTACRCTEDLYREANRYFDRVFLKILGMKGLLELPPGDMKLCFQRNRMDNLLVKTQAALNMKALGLAPEIWLERSGLSDDPSADAAKSELTGPAADRDGEK